MRIGEYIIHNYDLFYDSADSLNASLYVCAPCGGSDLVAYAAISRLGESGLWSNQPAKVVATHQKPSYAGQMRFLSCFELRIRTGTLLIVRYKHPKFVSDDDRWKKWYECLSSLGVD